MARRQPPHSSGGSSKGDSSLRMKSCRVSTTSCSGFLLSHLITTWVPDYSGTTACGPSRYKPPDNSVWNAVLSLQTVRQHRHSRADGNLCPLSVAEQTGIYVHSRLQRNMRLTVAVEAQQAVLLRARKLIVPLFPRCGHFFLTHLITPWVPDCSGTTA